MQHAIWTSMGFVCRNPISFDCPASKIFHLCIHMYSIEIMKLMINWWANLISFFFSRGIIELNWHAFIFLGRFDRICLHRNERKNQRIKFILLLLKLVHCFNKPINAIIIIIIYYLHIYSLVQELITVIIIFILYAVLISSFAVDDWKTWWNMEFFSWMKTQHNLYRYITFMCYILYLFRL